MVKSAKIRLKKVIGTTKLTFDLAQVEACLNSHPLTPLESAGEEGIEAFTPGYFLIGRPLSSIPDTSFAIPFSLFYVAGSYARLWSGSSSGNDPRNISTPSINETNGDTPLETSRWEML